MDPGGKKKFQWRLCTTFFVLLSFIIIALSGITLYITPPGRVANWSEWKFIELTKYQWQSIHTLFTFLFVAAIGVHLYFNWKVLLTYLKTKLHEGMHRKRELIFSSALSGMLLIIIITDRPPAKNVMAFGEDIANSWVSPKDEPLVPHAELLMFSDLSTKLQLKYKEVVVKLQERGITPDSSTIQIRDLAKSHNVTARELFAIIRPEHTKPLIQEGGGFGRKTVAQICEQYDIKIEDGLDRLHQNSIDASGEENLRELADTYETTPMDVMKIIIGSDE